MNLLAIESSCDESSAAIWQEGQLVANIVASQIPIHARYGGVVPELASRAHVLDVPKVVEQALASSQLSLEQIDAFAVTQGPGLVGSLLVGIEMAKALAYSVDKPLLGVNHIEAHLMAAAIAVEEGWDELSFPFVGLVVSGGHTSLYLVEETGRYTALGHTRDDAAGEALDKVGKMLGLGYPGGIHIDRLAKTGDRKALRFPRAMKRRGNLEFSFSGLKTSVLTHLEREGKPEGERALADLCASVQEAVVDVLVSKLIWAARANQAKCVVISGGVSANSRLRERLREASRSAGLAACVPPRSLCTDNAGMVAGLGAFYFERQPSACFSSHELNARSSWRI